MFQSQLHARMQEFVDEASGFIHCMLSVMTPHLTGTGSLLWGMTAFMKDTEFKHEEGSWTKIVVNESKLLSQGHFRSPLFLSHRADTTTSQRLQWRVEEHNTIHQPGRQGVLYKFQEPSHILLITFSFRNNIQCSLPHCSLVH